MGGELLTGLGLILGMMLAPRDSGGFLIEARPVK
ncbi:MAG: hypothetical protein JWR69_3967 [Pedosphaera sp.]|nr:hypothetical protein [Pedosphaera sp.]